MANLTNVNLNKFVTESLNQIINFINLEIKHDKNVDSWMLISTPLPMLSILTFYLVFVLKLGPKMMETRRPLNIKYIMMIYNLLQTLYNIFIVSKYIFKPGVISYLVNNFCIPDESKNNSDFINMFHVQTWHYFICKIFDLLDTVFFVLRKKQSHVSFLHVYHHMNMVITSWIFLRYIKGHQGALGGVLNSFIHTIMYSYYFLATLGPEVQKYLWWKKYLTSLQIIQFIIGLVCGLGLYFYDCNFQKLFGLYMMFNIILFLYLFLMFYKRTYSVKNKIQ